MRAIHSQRGFYKHAVIDYWAAIISLACTQGSILAHWAQIDINIYFYDGMI